MIVSFSEKNRTVVNMDRFFSCCEDQSNSSDRSESIGKRKGSSKSHSIRPLNEIVFFYIEMIRERQKKEEDNI